MASDEGLLSLIQAKFSSGETVTDKLDGVVFVCPEWGRKERILVIVKNGDEKALFALYSSCYPPKSFSDLSIERALPIDKNLKYEFEDGGFKTDATVYLSLIYKKSKFLFELQPSPQTSTFVEQLMRGIEGAPAANAEHSFTWLHTYTGTTTRESDSSPIDIPDIIVPRQSIALGTTPIAARESIIKYQMEMKEDDYTYLKELSIFVGTWNVNGQPPSIMLDTWLGAVAEPPDMYAIGFQELDLGTEAFLFDQTPREQEWLEIVVASLDKRAKYVKVSLVRLVGMMLIVFINEKYKRYVKRVDYDTVGTGIMGKMGNKGGVSIRFEFHNTSICFINSHLAAHVEEFERRNQDFHDIYARTQFSETAPPKGIQDHDQIYWLGDLNYRITELDGKSVKRLLDKEDFESILEWDQLKRQHAMKAVFAGYTESAIKFKPTYKYDPGTDNWDSSEKNRAPAWCDRILWKGNNIQQESYTSYPTLNISDHKPVGASFKSLIRVIDKKKYRKIHEEVIKKLDKLENEFLPQVAVDRTEIDFGTVRYLEPYVQQVIIANTGQVPVEFEFIKKLDESSYCKEWLNIKPYTQCIHPGEKCDIRLEIFVNKKSAYKLNSGEDRLYDILVLHLDGGKDIFITVDGWYEHSCFGSSIEALVNIKEPIREIPMGQLIHLMDENHLSGQSRYAVPKEIWFLVDHIYWHGLKQQHLFEQPGLHSELIKIRDWLDYGSLNAIPGSVHSVAEALLLLLESTSEPIIPYNHHSVCLSVSSNYMQCKQIIMQLPECRKNVFLYLCAFLQEVLLYSADNGSDCKTLSALFGSIFLRDPPNSQNDSRTRNARQLIERKKASFIMHFLTNDQSDFILGR